MFGLKGYAKGFAKAQLRSYNIYQSKYPDKSTQALSFAALKARGTFSDDLIMGWVKESKNFQDAVIAAAHYEYLTRGGNIPFNKYEEFESAIRQTIPADL